MHYAGHVWLEAAHPADALTAVNALLALDPRDADAWFTKGEAHAQAGQLDAAIAAYQQAISFRPDFTRAAEQVKLTRSSRRTSR